MEVLHELLLPHTHPRRSAHSSMPAGHAMTAPSWPGRPSFAFHPLRWPFLRAIRSTASSTPPSFTPKLRLDLHAHMRAYTTRSWHSPVRRFAVRCAARPRTQTDPTRTQAPARPPALNPRVPSLPGSPTPTRRTHATYRLELDTRPTRSPRPWRATHARAQWRVYS